MRIDIITIFPGMLGGFLRESMIKRATEMGAVELNMIQLRDFTTDKHRTTDDRPYGGGAGMVMKPEPLFAAVDSVRTAHASVILMSPQGRPLRQGVVRELAELEHLILICGHYEGVDERVREALITDEISIGDYVLTNGALAAAVVSDAVVRLLPGVLGGGVEAHQNESFSEGLLEYPHYTRPPKFQGMTVPDILVSGDHGAVEVWRKKQSEARTQRKRPDLAE